MANKRANQIQRVTHASQLRPTRGHTAIVVAADGDELELTYNKTDGIWTGGYRSFADYYRSIPEGYMSTSYQGGDSTMTVWSNGQDNTTFLANAVAFADGWRDDGLVAYNGYLVENPVMALKKWAKAGLVFQGRTTINAITEGNAQADTLNVGFGFSSADSTTFLIGSMPYQLEIELASGLADTSRRGVTDPVGSFAASYVDTSIRVGDWLTYSDFAPRIWPTAVMLTQNEANQTSYDIEAYAQYQEQTILIAVLSLREDGTTPTTPTITNSTATWVQVAETAFDVTGNMRAKLTVFRTESPSDGYYDSMTVDYGGVTHAGCMVMQLFLHNEDRSGTNGSAAVAQSATGTSASDADVSASLSAFANANSITLAFVGMTREADYPAINALTGWSDYAGSDMDAGAYFASLHAVWLYDEDTTPSLDLLNHDAAGMVAIELADAAVMDEPFIGDIGYPYVLGDVDDGLAGYTVGVRDLEVRYAAV